MNFEVRDIHTLLGNNKRLIQRILSYMDINDLSVLACTSKTFHQDTTMYYELTCKNLHLVDTLCRMIEQRVVLKEEGDILRRIQDGCFSYRWIYITWKRFRKVYRESVEKLWISDFYLSYIQYNHKNIHCFPGVLPGNYRLVVRMKVDENMLKQRRVIKPQTKPGVDITRNKTEIYWDTWKKLEDNPLKLIVRWNSSDTVDFVGMETEITWEFCDAMHQCRSQSHSVKLNGMCVLRHDLKSSPCMDIATKDFNVNETTNVIFELSDPDERWITFGIKWDYAHLQPI